MMQTTPQKKLSLLFLAADKFPPFGVDVAVLFGKEIVGRGHTIDWLLQSEKPLDHAIETKWAGGRAVVGRNFAGKTLWNRAKVHLYNFINDAKMFGMMARRPYDLVIIKDKFIAGFMAVLASKLYKTKFVYWLSFPIPEASIVRSSDGTAKYPFLYWLRGNFLKFLLYKVILPKSHHVFVQTDEMKKRVALNGIPEGKMTAVPMAVDTDQIKFVGYKNRKSQDERFVLYLGALNKFRRIDFILRAFQKVLYSVPNAKLILVGGSNIKEDEIFLHDESKKLKIRDATLITGRLPQAEALEFVKMADVCLSFIYPSPIFDVGSPTKLLEYMAMGKATVANDHPEQSVVLAESKAGICVPYDESAFTEAIVGLLLNLPEAQRMGIQGRQYILQKRNYQVTADIVEKKLQEIYFYPSRLPY